MHYKVIANSDYFMMYILHCTLTTEKNIFYNNPYASTLNNTLAINIGLQNRRLETCLPGRIWCIMILAYMFGASPGRKVIGICGNLLFRLSCGCSKADKKCLLMCWFYFFPFLLFLYMTYYASPNIFQKGDYLK